MQGSAQQLYSLASKMDTNKKRKITFKDDRDSKFVYQFKFFLFKILLSVVRRMPSKLFQGHHSKKIENHCLYHRQAIIIIANKPMRAFHSYTIKAKLYLHLTKTCLIRLSLQ